MCVGCEALEGGGVLGTEYVVHRGHVCVCMSRLRLLCASVLSLFPPGFVSAAGPKGQQEGQGVEGAKAAHSDDHARKVLALAFGGRKSSTHVLSREKVAPCAKKSVKAMSGIMLKPTRSI
jgi:hypothetical protein